MPPIVEVSELWFQYRSGTVPALNSVSFNVKQGDFVGITGPAGAGKTTLLSCINGVIPHYYSGELRGAVTVNGIRVADAGFRDLSRHVATVFEDPDFQMVSVGVEDEIAFGPENLGVPREEMEERIRDALMLTRITELRDRVISTLSGGQKQRVAIAAALSMLPRVMLLDDPTSELDPFGSQEVFAALRQLNREQGITVIMVSQDMERLVKHADKLLVISGGEIVLEGTVRQVCMHRQALKEIGVRIPDVGEFALRLSDRLGQHLSTGDIPLTDEEGIEFLRNILTNHGVIA